MLRNKIGYGFVLLFFGLFAILYNEYFTGILFVAMCLFPIVLLIVCIMILSGISYKLSAPDFIKNKGEEFPVIIQLHNKSFFPVSKMNLIFTYYNSFDKKVKKEILQVSMDHKSTQEVRIHMTSSYCGNIIIKLASIRVYDFLYIWSLKKKGKDSLLIPVLPNIHIEEEDIIEENRYIELESTEFSPYKGGDDPSEVFQIREYREGDKTNRVHWKLTFKQDELMIKEFSHPLNSNILVALDFFIEGREGNRLQLIDSLLECIMSTCFSLLEFEHKFQVMWKDKLKGEMQMEAGNDYDVYEMMDYLLQINIDEKADSILNVLDSELAKIYSHILYITTKIKIEEILNMGNQRSDTLILIYYIREMKDALNKEERDALEELRIQVFEIDITTKE